MDEGALRAEIAGLVQREREAAGLTHAELAARCGLTAASVARIERRTLAPGLDTIEKLFRVLGRRVLVRTEPLREPDTLDWLPLGTRLETSGLATLLRTLDPVPHVIDGALAAALQGVALPVQELELHLAWRDAAAFTGWLVRRLAYRWHDGRGEFRLLDLDPRAPGAHYWQTATGRVRARVADELPDSVDVSLGDAIYRVRPLADVTSQDDATGRLLRDALHSGRS